MLENLDRNKAGKGNWQSWHNAAMLLGGAVLGDEAWVRKAIEAPRNGFLYQMQVSVSEDGMWYENSWGYHFYTLSALQALVEGARRLGIDLWRHPDLKKMYTLPVAYAMADGSLPRFGDDVSSRVSRASRYLEYAYHAYKDPAMLPYLSRTETWDTVLLGRDVSEPPPAPARTSQVFPGAGHAILRPRGPAGLTAAFTFGPYGGFHGHYDKLSFVFFGHGRELGVDPGRARSQAYRLPIHRNWYKATISHNTVLVDGRSQKPAAGTLEAFGATDGYAAVVARCDDAYDGVRHRRLLCMTPTYLLIFDRLGSEAERRFDWVYHNRGSAVTCDAATEDHQLDPNEFIGHEYIQNVKQGSTDDPVHVTFDSAPVTVHLTVADEPATRVRIGDGVGSSILDRVPLAMLTRRGRTVEFLAVLEPVAGGKEPAVRGVSWKRTGTAIRITVLNGETRDMITIAPDQAVTIDSNGVLVLSSRAKR
jgi:hypothetical protein